ncbi:MAG: sce7726 family protein [Eubacteriales bacterium]|nr:sce7726 family protein [Eubacteriales bacterium]
MSNNNMILNSLFTQNVFHDLVFDGTNQVYSEVVRRYVSDPEDKNNEQIISEIYMYMASEYRNEYVYQNTLMNKLLLGVHSPRTTTALTQMPVGKSVADFILINGHAVVYEIKTELDSFSRLESQMYDYYKAFDQVCIVTSENRYECVDEFCEGTPVGIIVLTDQNRISRKKRKEPVEDRSKLEIGEIFRLLHKNEYEGILLEVYGELPVTSQVFYYSACREQFMDIPVNRAYSLTRKYLKKRNRIEVETIREVPLEMKSLVYFSEPLKNHTGELSEFLETKYGG